MSLNHIYIYILSLSYLGTDTTQDVNDDGTFKYYFMALAASIHAWEYCFPIILVNGATLKSKFCGTILATYTLDGNSKIVPLAFGVIDS